ncbi:MAG: ABC transporter permease [Candidatus Kapaibacterium sp.]
MSTAEPTARHESYGAYVRRQFRKHTLGVISLYTVLTLGVVAILADVLANEKPLAASVSGSVTFPVFKAYGVSLGVTTWTTDEGQRDWQQTTYDWVLFPPVPYAMTTVDKTAIKEKDRRPSSRHWLGTDDIGRDVLAGLIHGSRYALSIGFIAMGIALLIGISLGSVAGYFGGWIDLVISRLIEIFISLPTFFLVITIVAMTQDTVTEGRLLLIMAVIGLTSWTGIARLVRAEVLRVRNLEFVSAAQALGYGRARIILVHVLPNSLGPVLVSAAFGIASAILIESTLSFLGFGVPPTVITWGSLLARSRGFINMWWLATFPGILIFITVSAYNLIGDALRDATDPRLRS